MRDERRQHRRRPPPSRAPRRWPVRPAALGRRCRRPYRTACAQRAISDAHGNLLPALDASRHSSALSPWLLPSSCRDVLSRLRALKYSSRLGRPAAPPSACPPYITSLHGPTQGGHRTPAPTPYRTNATLAAVRVHHAPRERVQRGTATTGGGAAASAASTCRCCPSCCCWSRRPPLLAQWREPANGRQRLPRGTLTSKYLPRGRSYQ